MQTHKDTEKTSAEAKLAESQAAIETLHATLEEQKALMVAEQEARAKEGSAGGGWGAKRGAMDEKVRSGRQAWSARAPNRAGARAPHRAGARGWSALTPPGAGDALRKAKARRAGLKPRASLVQLVRRQCARRAPTTPRPAVLRGMNSRSQTARSWLGGSLRTQIYLQTRNL